MLKSVVSKLLHGNSILGTVRARLTGTSSPVKRS